MASRKRKVPDGVAALDHAPWAEQCAALCAGAPMPPHTERQSTSKAARNRHQPPSRRSVHRKRRRPGSGIAGARLFTPDVEKALLQLLPYLHATRVLRQSVVPGGPTLRALAVLMHLGMETAAGYDVAELMTAYGAKLREVEKLGERILAIGGIPAVLAEAALASRPTQARALDLVARGGPRLRAAKLDVGGAISGTDSERAADVRLQPPALPPGAAVSASATAAVPTSSDAEAAPKLPSEQLPGGSRHCGGDLLFPNLALLEGERRGLTPLFIMVPGAGAGFYGAEQLHCTTGHDERARRAEGCAAHVSFAVQTPAQTLGLAPKSPACRAIHKRVQTAAAADAAGAAWRDAVWLAVYDADACTPRPAAPTVKAEHDPALMAALPWRRIVLYDASSGRPLVFYDADGGLRDGDAARARSAFAFLDDFQYTLHRQRESRASGALGVDGVGGQRMVMLGVRQQKFGCARPEKRRKGRVAVANTCGDVDAYVGHWDNDAVGCAERVQPTWDAMEGCMCRMLPEACGVMAEAIRGARVTDRLYTREAREFMSRGHGLVNNVGASSAYQSPAHVDANDVGITFAFAVKCGLCARHVK